jgi:hypothetical protein
MPKPKRCGAGFQLPIFGKAIHVSLDAIKPPGSSLCPARLELTAVLS